MIYFEARIPGKIAFVEGDVPALEKQTFNDVDITYDLLLADFINLYKENYRGESTISGIEAFARAHGSLTNIDWLEPVSLPKGSASIATSNFEAVCAPQTIYLEDLSLWEKHVTTMRDISLLAYLKVKKTRYNHHFCVRYMLNNLIFFKGIDGRNKYLYHGSTSFYETETPNNQVSPQIKHYLNNFQNPYIYIADASNEEDSIEARQAWMKHNAKKIMKSYLFEYLKIYKISDEHLLGKLQKALVGSTEKQRPLFFCVVCGKAYTSYRSNVTSARYCDAVCRNKFYNYQDKLIEEMSGLTALSLDEAHRVL